MPVIDYEEARRILEISFADAESAFLRGEPPKIGRDVAQAYDVLYKSKTQGFREALLGCVLARLQDKTVNIRLPYVGQGPDSYNGRSLDELAVNPFLQSRQIPCSMSPFLNIFRRGARFDESYREKVRDRAAFDQFLQIIKSIEVASGESDLRRLLLYHLWRFVQLRETSRVELSRLNRISLDQCDILITGLLETQSGGRYPLFLIVTTFRVINQVFGLGWDIQFQGINVSDRASKAGGDVTISKDGRIILASEVTERPVDRSRVVSTFNTKIAPQAIEEYLFFVKEREAAAKAMEQAKRYFSQGHEVNFLEIKNWIVAVLSIVGKEGRSQFMSEMVSFLGDVDVPKSLKVTWNDLLASIAGSGK